MKIVDFDLMYLQWYIIAFSIFTAFFVLFLILLFLAFKRRNFARKIFSIVGSVFCLGVMLTCIFVEEEHHETPTAYCLTIENYEYKYFGRMQNDYIEWTDHKVLGKDILINLDLYEGDEEFIEVVGIDYYKELADMYGSYNGGNFLKLKETRKDFQGATYYIKENSYVVWTAKISGKLFTYHYFERTNKTTDFLESFKKIVWLI